MQNQVNQPNQVMQGTQPVIQQGFQPVSQATLRQHMIANNLTKVDVVRNPKNGKLFVSFNGGVSTAAYSNKLTAADLSFDLIISIMADGTPVVHAGGSSENVQASLSL